MQMRLKLRFFSICIWSSPSSSTRLRTPPFLTRNILECNGHRFVQTKNLLKPYHRRSVRFRLEQYGELANVSKTTKKLLVPSLLGSIHEAYDEDLKLRQKKAEIWRNKFIRQSLIHQGLTEECDVTPHIWESVIEEARRNDNYPWLVLLDFCAHSGASFYDMGLKLWEEMEGLKMGFTARVSFLKLLVNNVDERPEREDRLLREYDAYVADFPSTVSIPVVARELLSVIAQTKEWKRGFGILGGLKSSKQAMWCDFLSLLRAAAQRGELDVVLMLHQNYLVYSKLSANLCLLQHAIVNVSKVWNGVLTVSLNGNSERSTENLAKILQRWRDSCYVPHRDEIEKVSEWFVARLGKDRVRLNVRMPSSGVCPLTGNQLEPLQLQKIDQLRGMFYEKALVSDNVYKNSHPRELASYRKFSHKFLPFDAVVDGLNVFHAAYRTDYAEQMRWGLRDVISIVRLLRERGMKKVVVFSRRWWGKEQFSGDLAELKRLARVFLLDKLSNDDLFLLHCWLGSGEKCYVVSNDLFEDARKALPTSFREAMLTLQLMRQAHVVFDGAKDTIDLVMPRTYKAVVQERGGRLYVPFHPYTEEEFRNLADVFDLGGVSSSISCSYRIPDTFVVVDLKGDSILGEKNV